MNSLTTLAQFTTQQPDDGKLERRYDLRKGDLVVIFDHLCAVVAREKNVVVFTSTTNGEITILSDSQIGSMLAKGEFRTKTLFPDRDGSRREWLRDRRSLSPAQTQEGERRLEYVTAALKGNAEPNGSVMVDKPSRSRRLLLPIIHAVATRRNEKAPGFSTVLNWVDQWQKDGTRNGIACLVPNYEFRGNRFRWDARTIEASKMAIDHWLNPKVSVVDAHAVLTVQLVPDIAESGHPSANDEHAPPKVPSRRTLSRWCSSVPAFTRDYYRIGPAYARKEHKVYDKRKRPTQPYEEIEADHCTLDIIVLDTSRRVILGRPVLIFFIDRATAMIVGYSIALEEPSYASLLEGLANTMQPKDLSKFEDLDLGWWNPHGRIGTLILDFAMENRSNHLMRAATELGFTVRLMRPASPWQKGQVERSFQTLNHKIFHRLSGATMSNPLERKQYDDTGEPKLTIDEVEELVVEWIVNEFNVSPTRSVPMRLSDDHPPIPGTETIPLKNWEKSVGSMMMSIAATPSREVFEALCGETIEVTIGNRGIEWDGITYSSADLNILRSKERAGASNRSRSKQKYRCSRNPNDLGHLNLVNPFEAGAIIRVPAATSDLEYANGITRRMHNLFKLEARLELEEISKQNPRADEVPLINRLIAAKAKRSLKMVALSPNPRKKRADDVTTRHLRAEDSRRARSNLTTRRTLENEDTIPTYAPRDRKAYENSPPTETKHPPVVITDAQSDLPPVQSQDVSSTAPEPMSAAARERNRHLPIGAYDDD